MKVLAVETATSAMGVCVESAAGRVSLSVDVGLDHGKRLAHLIATALGECGLTVDELDLIACGIGPGSFTGVRIGVATAFGMARACRAGLIGVSGLDAAGYRFSHFPGVVLALIDARKRRFYGAMYRGGRRLTGYLDESAETIARRVSGLQPVLLIGPAAAAVHAVCDQQDDVSVDAGAAVSDPAALASLGRERYARQVVHRAILRPAYLRASEAEIGLRPHERR